MDDAVFKFLNSGPEGFRYIKIVTYQGIEYMIKQVIDTILSYQATGNGNPSLNLSKTSPGIPS